MAQLAPISNTIPPRRNELGAQWNRFETLCRQTLDCEEKLAHLNLRYCRSAMLGGQSALQKMLVARSPEQSAEQWMHELSALASHLSEVASISNVLFNHYRSWIDASLSHSGNEWLRRLRPAPAKQLGSGAAAMNLQHAKHGGNGAEPPVEAPRSRATASKSIDVV